MKNFTMFLALLIIFSAPIFAQDNVYDKFIFLLGKWKGTGSGFGNDKSAIESDFNLIMNGKYIEVKNDSKFEPTEKNPEGEHHIDWGIISFNKNRKKIIFRQFHIEGFVNQYVLNDSLSNDTILIFETEVIENFPEGGKARWTIRKIKENEIETIFEVSFSGKEFVCYGTNKMMKQ